MVDPDGVTVERVRFQPSWLSFGETPEGEFTEFVGGFDALTIPDSSATYGNMSVMQYRTGKVEAKLVPSYMPIAVTRIAVHQDTVDMSVRGIGGGPDMIRLIASVGRYEETPLPGGGVNFDIEYPLHRKIVIGLDDTDSAVKGATFRTAMQIALMLSRAIPGVEFLRMTISMNWPGNPYKTTNNASTALVFAVRPNRVEELIDWFTTLAQRHTISEDTGMVVFNRVRIPDPLLTYAYQVKSTLVDVEDTYNTAKTVGATLIPVTGDRGLIGALAAVGLVDCPDEAITPFKLHNTDQQHLH